MGLFGKSKPADPKALVDEWSKKVRKEGYGLDRQIRQIQRQEQLAIKSIKDATKKGKYFIICLFRIIVHHLTGCHISISAGSIMSKRDLTSCVDTVTGSFEFSSSRVIECSSFDSNPLDLITRSPLTSNLRPKLE